MRRLMCSVLKIFQQFIVCTIFSLAIVLPAQIDAQDKTNDIPFVRHLKQIDGIYDSNARTFYGQFIDTGNIKIIHRFESRKFKDDVGIVEYYYTNAASGFKSEITVGLIDTSGKILIPCIYEELYLTGNKDFYVFYTPDTTGIFRVRKGAIFQLPRKTQTYYNGIIANDTNNKFCVVRINNSDGVFSFFKERLVVPAEYLKISLLGSAAICQDTNNFVVYDCTKEVKSQTLKEVFPLNKGAYYFLRFVSGRALVCTDPISPDSSIYQKINRDEAIEFYNNHVISKSNGMCGLLDEYGNVTVPFIYDDIYFFDENLLMVKDSGFWAIADYHNKVLTGFQFINVDKQNLVNLRNFIQFSGIDTSANVISNIGDSNLGYGKSNAELLACIKKELNAIKSELYAHKLSRYDKYVFPRYVLQSEGGFQIVTVGLQDEIIIDSLTWDNVYMIPSVYDYPFEIGVQKGNKYGYYDSNKKINSYLRYDGVYFYYELFFYEGILFSGTHNERSPFTIVKRGHVYSRSSYSKTNWLQRITTPPNWPTKYQGRPKWKKYMEEDDFLKRRKEKSNA